MSHAVVYHFRTLPQECSRTPREGIGAVGKRNTLLQESPEPGAWVRFTGACLPTTPSKRSKTVKRFAGNARPRRLKLPIWHNLCNSMNGV